MKKVLLLAVLIAVSGCSTVDLPSRLPDTEHAIAATTGAWIVLYDSTSLVASAKHEGELIAVAQDSVFLFQDSILIGVGKRRISVAKLFVVDPPITSAGANLWVIMGTLSTVSHGILLIISAPAWLIVGSVSAAAAVKAIDEGDYRYPNPGHGWAEFEQFARFPQGLPPNIDRSQLRARVTMPKEED